VGVIEDMKEKGTQRDMVLKRKDSGLLVPDGRTFAPLELTLLFMGLHQ
jgi:hypothetical protein